MKALSIWQPYATALFTPLKPDETRSWKIPAKLLGQPIAIQAGLHDAPDERLFFARQLVKPKVQGYPHPAEEFAKLNVNEFANLARGYVIGWVVFGNCVDAVKMAREVREAAQIEWGKYIPGWFAWSVIKCELFPRAYPCAGKQGFFDWTRPD